MTTHLLSAGIDHLESTGHTHDLRRSTAVDEWLLASEPWLAVHPTDPSAAVYAEGIVSLPTGKLPRLDSTPLLYEYA